MLEPEEFWHDRFYGCNFAAFPSPILWAPRLRRRGTPGSLSLGPLRVTATAPYVSLVRRPIGLTRSPAVLCFSQTWRVRIPRPSRIGTTRPLRLPPRSSALAKPRLCIPGAPPRRSSLTDSPLTIRAFAPFRRKTLFAFRVREIYHDGQAQTCDDLA